MSYREQLRRAAAYQHGIVTTADAEEADVPAVELRKLAQRGAIQRIGHGVYRFDTSPVRQAQQRPKRRLLSAIKLILKANLFLVFWNLGMQTHRESKWRRLVKIAERFLRG